MEDDPVEMGILDQDLRKNPGQTMDSRTGVADCPGLLPGEADPADKGTTNHQSRDCWIAWRKDKLRAVERLGGKTG